MKLKLLLLLGVLLLAFFNRSYLFLNQDVLILQDQGRDLLLVREVVEKLDPILIGGHTGFGGLFHGPLWIYALVPTFVLSSGHPFWTLVPVYLAVSLGILVALFYFGWKYYGWIAGLLMAFFAAVSHTFADTINYTSNAQMMPLFFVMYLIGLIGYMRGSPRWLLLSAVAIGLGIHVEVAFAVMLLPITLLACVLWRIFPPWKLLFSCAAVLFLCVSNYLLFDIRNDFLMTKSALRLVTEGTPVDERTAVYRDPVYRVSDRLVWIGNLFRSPLPAFDATFLYFVVVVLVTAYLAFCGFTYKQYGELTHRSKEQLFLLFLFLVIMVFYMLYPSELHAHYVQSLALVPIMVMGYICSRIVRSRLLKPVGIGIVGLFCLFALVDLQKTYATPYSLEDNGSLRTNLVVIDAMFEDAAGQEFGYFVYDPPIVTYGPDYMIQWRGKTKWKYVPKNVKKDPTYLVMYAANLGDDQAHAFWKENVVRTKAEVLWRKEFVKGTVVEKVNMVQDEQQVDPNYFIGLTFR